jgi:hypothetical protein
MHSGHIQEWRDYLATQMRAQYGLAEQEAQKITDRWLRPPTLPTLAHGLR